MIIPETIGSLLLAMALALFALGWVAYGISSVRQSRCRHPRHASQTCIPRRRLSRREIIDIATGGRIIPLATSTLSAILLTIALFLGRRFWLTTALGMAVGFFAIAAFYGYIVFQDCLRPLTPLLRQESAFPQGAAFRYVDGAWQYADENWFIRFEEHTACAFFAPELDSNAPISYTAQLSFENGGRAVKPAAYSAMEAAKRSGDVYIGRIGYCPQLEQWIVGHGGTIG